MIEILIYYNNISMIGDNMLKVERIEILLNIKGTDQITLITNFPNTFPMVPEQGNMRMDIDLQHGTAIKYVKTHFGSDPSFPATATVIDGKAGTKEVISISDNL